VKLPYKIDFIKTSETLRWIVLEDAWSLRKDFRWKWQARLANWLIRRIGVFAREPTVDIERIIIDPPAIMQRLFEQQAAMLDMNREPKRMLIGSEDFAELMHQPEIRHYFTVDCDYYKYGSDGRRIMGLTIEVIPWMRGILVMP
jgi:hypothetical protein